MKKNLRKFQIILYKFTFIIRKLLLFIALKKDNKSKNKNSKILKLIANKEWCEAEKLLDNSLPFWLQDNVKKCAEIERMVGSDYSDNISIKIASLKYINDFKVIKSKKFTGGCINFISFIHELFNKKGNSLLVFEKIYGKHLAYKAKREYYLFKNVHTDDLGAPNFYGIYESEHTVSVFYEYLVGEYATSKKTLCQAACHLWLNAKADGIPESYHANPYLKLKDSVLAKYGKLLSEKSSFLICRIDELYGLIESFPDVVIHNDIVYKNIIKTSSAEYLIDWDKWFVSKVGAGLPIDPDDFELIDGLVSIDQICIRLDINRQMLLYSIALHCFLESVHKNKFKEADSFSKYVLCFLSEIDAELH